MPCSPVPQREPGCRCSRLSLPLALTLILSGCNQTAETNLGYPSHATNDGEIALNNLSAEIQGRLRALERRPGDLDFLSGVIDRLLERVRFASTFQDFQKAAQLLASAGPKTDPEWIKMRSTLAATLHRFNEAEQLLNTSDFPDKPIRRAKLALATGRLTTRQVELFEQQASQQPSFNTLADLALAQAEIGNYEAADDTFLRALSTYRNVSPFPYAWVAFSRGLMWAEQADQPMRALAHYRVAVKRLPGYVVAQIHLAELEAQFLGQPRAVTRLRDLLQRTDDPEAMGLLGELLQIQGQTSAANRWIASAKARYETLLTDHPEAFWDHAAEFFSGPGADPQRALNLALKNLTLRPSARAYQIALEAAQAANNITELCRLIDGARGLPHPSKNLDALLAQLTDLCTR